MACGGNLRYGQGGEQIHSILSNNTNVMNPSSNA